tara:strand:+ start:675 stop:932 length:258 start_codon:yes stop_codon:yes gene_type:complete
MPDEYDYEPEDTAEYDYHQSQEEELCIDAKRDGQKAFRDFYFKGIQAKNPHPPGCSEYRWFWKGYNHECNEPAVRIYQRYFDKAS